ncbi:MAG: flagellar hook protein [Sphingomonadales bacterium]|nr:flagellar hook protein [Sphingomonadales bacterium]MBU3991605.1 flagellar filament capping protein FliD [Alphaproteobacteria bacterium]
MPTSTTSAIQSSTASSILTSLNGANAIDWNTLAANLAVAQFANRTDRLAFRSDTLDQQISSAGNLKSSLLALSTSLGDRVRSGDLSPQPSLSNSAVARPVLSGSTTPRGTYSLEVTQLAKAQTLAGPALATGASPVGSGTLTLRFGTVSGASFAEDTGHAAVDITIAAGATLADVAAAINGANAGVSAYVANTTAGARLVMKGQEGAGNGFVLEASEDPADPGLAQLAWQPASGDPARLLTASADAAYLLDGLPMAATGNTVNEAIPGLNLTLTATNIGAPATLTFADNTAAITTAMQDLTAALNEIAGQVKTATDPIGGDLARDGGALALKRAMSQLSGTVIMPNAAANAPRTLADLGVSIQRDGTFLLDGARLAATLKADPNGVAAMFTNGLHGVYGTIDALNRKMSSSADASSLAASIARYTSQKGKVTTDLSGLADKQEALRVQLVSRFATTQTAVAASTSTLSFLKSQIDAWNSSKN